MSDVEISGSCAPRFARVKDAFAKNFAVDGDVGASFAATLNGETVIDLWGGGADAARTRPWQRDTLVNVWSTTKAMAALSGHVLVDRGLLDLDAPVARYWPEFAAQGKERIPVRWLFSHQSGLAGWSAPMAPADILDWKKSTQMLADQAPLWEPGTRSGYHGLTFGHLIGEVLRRIDGRTLGAFFRDEVATPLGAEFWIGLPESHEPRVAQIIPSAPGPLIPTASEPSPVQRALGNPALGAMTANTRAWRAAEVPAANGQANARGAARAMAALACGGAVDGVRVISQKTLDQAITEQCYGKDLVLGPMRWGLGFMLASKDLPISPNPRTFGHGGAGGSFALADCDARASLAYVMNQMKQGTTGDKRLARCLRAFYAALA